MIKLERRVYTIYAAKIGHKELCPSFFATDDKNKLLNVIDFS